MIGLYVHWPYCTAICPYCDFNVYLARGADTETLAQAICADMADQTVRFPAPGPLSSVFFGGGTPSLMPPSAVAAILNAADRLWGLAPDAEVSLEANPEDRSGFGPLVQAGINRLSLGLQALNDADLKALGRFHSTQDGLEAVDAAQKACDRVSIDLIYAREGQSLDAWRAELMRALGLGVEHLALYQLTIEPDTAFAKRVERGALIPPETDAAAALYEATEAQCAQAGYAAYEISNYARAPAARARHNETYWRYGIWYGVGPGAHGRVRTAEGDVVATQAERRPARYIAGAREGSALAESRILSLREAAEEGLMMGLRHVDGVRLGPLIDALGEGWNAGACEALTQDGWLVRNGDRLAVSKRGRLVLDYLCGRLIGG
ncbi:MAG: radical SAM family heme chaperone HemW [Maricaulaceae bacterium]